MNKDPAFVEYIIDVLSPYGSIKTRAMFGGFGVYKDAIIIAIIVDNELYFKGDKISAQYYESQGSVQFSYESKGRVVRMSYWRVNPDVLENPDELKVWVDHACQASVNFTKKL